MTRSNIRASFAAALVAAMLALAIPPAAASEAARTAASGATTATAPAVTAAPFAKVYLALRGCTSCAHCRTAIRQMAKGGAKGGEARLNGSEVEVLYKTPRVVPLRDVIRGLAENRLHDLDLVDVLFEARGTIGTSADGTLRFTLSDTGQTFPVSIPAGLARPAKGGAVHLVAVVNGWRERTDLTLSAREIRTSS
jgi:hypothetical protein